MAQLRKNAINWKGNPVDVEGPELKVGDKAPSDFVVAANDLKAVSGQELAGKTRVLLSVPSLDTAVCDMEVRRFNQEAAKIGNLGIYACSMDLPFAQKRWCGAAGIEKVQTLSDFKARNFATAHGVFVPSIGLMCRAVFVIDSKDTIRHVEYVRDAVHEPNYQAALEVAKSLS